MKKFIPGIISTIVCFMFSQPLMAGDISSPQWCQPFTVKGMLKKGNATHPGNGGKFIIHILMLNQPLTIPAGKCDGVDIDSATEVKEIQVKEDDKPLAKFVGKTVVVSGAAGYPENYYDVRDVIVFPPFTIKVSN